MPSEPMIIVYGDFRPRAIAYNNFIQYTKIHIMYVLINAVNIIIIFYALRTAGHWSRGTLRGHRLIADQFDLANSIV
jgi:hypothetical protein